MGRVGGHTPEDRVRVVPRREARVDEPAPRPAWNSKSSTRLQCARMRPFRRELFRRASRTRREPSIRPKISRIDFDVAERESSQVWSGRPKPAVDSHAAVGAPATRTHRASRACTARAPQAPQRAQRSSQSSWNAPADDRDRCLCIDVRTTRPTLPVRTCEEIKSSTQLKCARNLRLCFENSMRAIDSSKNQPNRLRFDRDGEF